MEWGADSILALRKHAGMTQAQIAQWLGVTVKQVKYLEHQRRNPSGPTRRLLSILATELKFGDAPPVRVLGVSIVTRSVAKPVSLRRDHPPISPGPPQDTPVAVSAVIQGIDAPKPVDEKPPTRPEADQPPDDGAFSWL